MNENKNQKFWDSLSKFLTFLIVAIYLTNILNDIFHFIPTTNIVYDILFYLTYYGPMALVIIVSLEVIDGQKSNLKYLLLLCWVFIIIFSISPNFFGLIK